jgi:hypothetical protein
MATMQKVIAKETLVASVTTTSLLVVVAVQVRDVAMATVILIIICWCFRLFGILVLVQIHLSCSRRNVGVELVVQLMNLLVQVVIVFFCIGQLLL